MSNVADLLLLSFIWMQFYTFLETTLVTLSLLPYFVAFFSDQEIPGTPGPIAATFLTFGEVFATFSFINFLAMSLTQIFFPDLFSFELSICIECTGLFDHAHFIGSSQYHNHWGDAFSHLYTCFPPYETSLSLNSFSISVWYMVLVLLNFGFNRHSRRSAQQNGVTILVERKTLNRSEFVLDWNILCCCQFVSIFF